MKYMDDILWDTYRYAVRYVRNMLRDKSQQEGPQGLDVRGIQHGPLPHHTLLDRGCSLEQDIVTLAVLCSSKHNIYSCK